jgi:Zn-dependent protease
VSDQIIGSVIAVAIMLLVGFPIHEFSHALAAYRLGDSTAKHLGRLTLNPVAHFDPLGGILLAVSFIAGGFGIGWAKPTPVNPRNLEYGRWGEAIVAAAGPLSNLVLALIVVLPLRYLGGHPELAQGVPGLVLDVALEFVFINVVLMVFNLFPVPPLDGSKVLFAFLPPRLAFQWRPIIEQYGFILLVLLFLVPPGNSIGGRIVTPVVYGIFDVLLGS